MAKNNEHYQAGGGDKRFKELRARYPNISEGSIRNMVVQEGKRVLAEQGKKAASDLTNDQAFSYGGGNAALAELKRKNPGLSDSYLRNHLEQKGRRAIAGRGDGSLPTPTKPSETDKQVSKDNKQYGDTFPEGSFGITKKQIKINQEDPDTPTEPVVETTESDTLAASEVTKPLSQRELLIKEARTKYKDSPFKQWAHANQKLAMALKPGQVGYAQVQEYFKEQKGKLKVKPQEQPFIKPNATQLQMGPGANDLRGYASTIA